jgi:hypothetical protein
LFWRSGFPIPKRGSRTRPRRGDHRYTVSRTLCDALLAEDLAEEHHWVPIPAGSPFAFNMTMTSHMPSGLCVFPTWDARLKTASDSGLSPRIKSLLKPFVGCPPDRSRTDHRAGCVSSSLLHQSYEPIYCRSAVSVQHWTPLKQIVWRLIGLTFIHHNNQKCTRVNIPALRH